MQKNRTSQETKIKIICFSFSVIYYRRLMQCAVRLRNELHHSLIKFYVPKYIFVSIRNETERFWAHGYCESERERERVIVVTTYTLHRNGEMAASAAKAISLANAKRTKTAAIVAHWAHNILLTNSQYSSPEIVITHHFQYKVLGRETVLNYEHHTLPEYFQPCHIHIGIFKYHNTVCHSSANKKRPQ